MKKLFLLFLFTFILCQNTTPNNFFSSNIFDSIKCVLKTDFIMNSFFKILAEINTKDFSKILNVLYSIFLDFKDKFIKCSEQSNKVKAVKAIDENGDDMDIKLGYPRAVLLLYTIIGEQAFEWFEKGGYPLLKSNCQYFYGQNEWYCKFIRDQ